MSTLCNDCPRQCNIDRSKCAGFCGETSDVFLARAALHFWEEPCISASEGSGAVFFSGCNLRCVFCQNGNIANGSVGKKITVERLAEIFLELQAKGANNINLVTPSHYVDAVSRALEMVGRKKSVERSRLSISSDDSLQEKGLTTLEQYSGGANTADLVETEENPARSVDNRSLKVPVVWNSSAYELPETLRRVEGQVDVWLPDFKYVTPELAKKYSRAEDYPERAKATLEEMVRQAGPAEFDDEGKIRRGVIVRHLILPGHTKESKAVLKYLHETYGNDIYISIMNQYTPMPWIAEKCPELNRKVTRREYDKVLDYALELGIENGFSQEGSAAKESFIPNFNYEGV